MMRLGARQRGTGLSELRASGPAPGVGRALVMASALASSLIWGAAALAQSAPVLAAPAPPPPPAAIALAPPVRERVVAGPVVLELYTSQGCVSCPPADRMLATLIDRDDVIPLALHVDYWDYIGWADAFADPEHGERQKRYARRHGHSTIYTPQVVINGIDIMEGFRVMQVMDAIEAQRRVPAVAVVSLTRGADGALEIRAEALEEPPPLVASRAQGRTAASLSAAMIEAASDAPGPVGGEAGHDVQLVRYMPRAMTEITAGENAGLTADYVNIVTSWQTVATWDLRAPLEISVGVTGDQPMVVLIQEPGQGAIIAAAQLR
jgi:hypothetical protein